MDLRILFLVLMGFTAILFVIRQGGTQVTLSDVGQMLLDVLLVPSALLTVLVFAILITGTDVRQLLVTGLDRISNRTVSFVTAVPENMQDAMMARVVERVDTDGDGFKEWVVFFEFDLQPGRSPVKIAVYDNDRGNPPVIFPYQLRVPNREYLSENIKGVQFDMVELTPNPAGSPSEQPNLPEMVVQDGRQLSAFRYRENSEPWDFPRDTPPRYEPIGFFYGSGGVKLDDATKEVTVIDRDKFNRSQLAMRSIYALNPVSNSYWDDLDPTVLAAPTMATVDFFSSPPQDVLNSPYPEKIVLAFYASTCAAPPDKTLCRHAEVDWKPQQFLAENSVAWNEFFNSGGGPGYFGLKSFDGTQNLVVSDIRYYPTLESLNTRNVVTGAEPRENIVDITFKADGANFEETRSYKMEMVAGQWKIAERVPSPTTISGGNPSTKINTAN